MATTANKTPAELEEQAATVRERIRSAEQARVLLLHKAIEADEDGVALNGTRLKLVEADAELDILKGRLARIEAAIPEAKESAEAAWRAGKVEEMRQTEANATPHVLEAVGHARRMLREVDALRPFISAWGVLSAQTGSGKAASETVSRRALATVALGPDGAEAFEAFAAACDRVRMALALPGLREVGDG